jgi:S-adenosylmethionine:tRNA ribosyltransferase-isomerase
VGLCSDYAKETFQGDKYGVINSKRWNDATSWLLEGNEKVKDFGLDADIWQPSPHLLAGNELARTTLESAKDEALRFKTAHGRSPSLAVITVGELSRYTHGQRRKQIYSNDSQSWFNKTSVGEANNFAVKEINLPESTSEDDLLSCLYSVKNFDGIQLMWPLPSHINSSRVYNQIDVDRDVDGAHFIGQLELDPTSSPMPAVTPSAVMDLINNNNIDVKGSSVLVVGRSRIVGSPLSHMLRKAGAIVTVAHSEVPIQKLEDLVGSADVVISCAGAPALMKSEWLKPGADVINVGTTFCEEKEKLLSDFEGDLSKTASKFSPVPGGIGPLSVACLFKNVAAAAWNREARTGDIDSTWVKKSGALHRSIHFKDYDSALHFANKVNVVSSQIDHHANMSFCHKCVDGVDLDLEFFTYEAGEVTEKDYKAAKMVNTIFDEEKINMKDFTYNLKVESIAKYPAEPRGSSRLLRVDSKGKVTHFSNFSDSFLSLTEGAHIIFNESKVVNARVEVLQSGKKDSLELMILDLGDSVEKKSNGSQLTVMLRRERVQVGDIFTAKHGQGKVKFQVKEIIGPWIEDEKSNGNGTECIVECITEGNKTVSEVLDVVGSVPIPPYLDRDAEIIDDGAYNNVYAAGNGSVAAPTAGLHFTDDLLAQIGSENTSFLSLHVGAGTFKPVVTEDARDHSMHGEHFSVSVSELIRITDSLDNGRRMIVVGTTSCRTLESLYWCGVKILMQSKQDEGVDNGLLELDQNEWVQLSNDGDTYSAAEALTAVIQNKKEHEFVEGRTSLMIVPGKYNFKVVDELITNFHAPDSTLMLLVSAFLGSGDKVRNVYHEAQDLGYRFLSYGDVCFFSKQDEEGKK